MYASAVMTFTHLFTYDLDLWPLILKIFSAMPTHVMNISAKFRWYPFTKYRGMALREIHVRWTQPCIPPGSLNRVPASAGVKTGKSPLPDGR